MKLKYKLTIWAIVIDFLLYLFLFHSGIVLPFINPSQDAYNRQFTSFPRNAMQIYAWIGLHFPTSIIISVALGLGDKFLSLSVVQTGIIFFGIGAFIDHRRKKKMINSVA